MKRKLLSFILGGIIFLSGCQKALELTSDSTPPGEVSQLQLEKLDVSVKLTWVDPKDKDFKAVKLTIYNADNQNQVRSVDVLPDSLKYTFESLAAGNYFVKVQTRDKENQLSEGVEIPFVFLSKSPVNVKNIRTAVYWNVLHLDWDSLTSKDYETVVEGQKLVEPVDSIIVVVDNTTKIKLQATATGAVIPDLSDGNHSVKIYTKGHSGYYSGIYQQGFDPITFGEKFVRVQGDGFDFYIARYEVTTEEYRKFIVDDLGILEAYAPYLVDPSKVEADARYKWWYGTDPKYTGTLYLLGFNSWEFTLDAGGWQCNRYLPNAAFGKITWEGAML
ncbi:MAG TPA: hypothetical protein VIH57_14450, partial [Bacteroidales bacterium]